MFIMQNDRRRKLESARKETVSVKETQWHSPVKSPYCGVFCLLWLQEILLKKQNSKKDVIYDFFYFVSGSGEGGGGGRY